jgi:hypothetical protein
VLVGGQAARVPQGVRVARRGEVLPPRLLREPPAGGREVQTQIELCLAGRQTIPSGGFQYLQLGVVWSQ